MNAKILKLIDSNTAKVECTEYKKHKVYAKYLTTKRRYLVDVRGFKIIEGDQVEINPCPPVSKKKRWAITNVIKSIS